MKITVSLLTAILLCLTSQAQQMNWSWINDASGNGDHRVYCPVVDKNFNVYVTGTFSGTTMTIGTVSLTNVGQSGTTDVYLAKYDSVGNLIWAKSAGGPFVDVASDVAVDDAGNVLITGHFSGSVNFGSDTLVSSGSVDLFIVKYDPAGNVMWAKKAGGTGGNTWGRAIVADTVGNIYLTGHFNSPSIEVGPDMLNNPGVFVAKYDPSGNVLWTNNAVGNALDISNDIAVDGSGNVYCAGTFVYSISFGAVNLQSQGSDDAFIVKFDNMGSAVWAQRAGGVEDDQCNGLALDNTGNLYVIGRYASSQMFFGGYVLPNSGAPNTGDVFVAKFTSAGAFIWARGHGSSSDDIGRHIVVDAAGNTWISGEMGDYILWPFSLPNHGWSDVYFAFLDPNGTIQWAESVGGNNLEVNGGIALDKFDNPYVSGSFQSSIIAFDTVSISKNGVSDIFIAKYHSCMVPPSPNIIQSGNILTTSTAFTSYQWYFEFNPIPGANSQSYTASVSGDYQVAVSDENWCFNISSPIGVIVGIDELNGKSGLTVYPNPADDLLYVVFNSIQEGPVDLYDQLGRRVLHATLVEGKAQLNMQSLAAGVYFLIAGQYQPVKVIKE